MASSTVRPSTSGSHDSHDPPNPLPRLSTSLGGETDPDQGAGPSSPSVQWSRPFPPARNTSNASNRSHRSRHHPPSPPSVPNPAPSSSPSALGHQGDMPPLMPPFRGIRPSDTLGTLATIDAPNGSHGGPYEPAPVPRVPDSQHQKVAEKDGGAHERLPILSDQNWDRYQSPAGAFPTSQNEGWEEAFERQRVKRWKEKVDADLLGWRGGNGCVHRKFLLHLLKETLFLLAARQGLDIPKRQSLPTATTVNLRVGSLVVTCRKRSSV